LINVCEIVDPLPALAFNAGFGVGIVHAYTVFAGTRSPNTPFAGDTLNGDPEQLVSSLLLILGVGFTVTVTSKVLPEQGSTNPELGVTKYVTV
jgi:hypothetical protein